MELNWKQQGLIIVTFLHMEEPSTIHIPSAWLHQCVIENIAASVHSMIRNDLVTSTDRFALYRDIASAPHCEVVVGLCVRNEAMYLQHRFGVVC